MEIAAHISVALARVRALAPGRAGLRPCGHRSGVLPRHYGAPMMLFALLLGMAMNFLSDGGPCRAGVEFSAKQLLRIGIALLGLRIIAGQVAALGWGPIVMVVS